MVDGAAFRAGVRPPLGMAAMMADELPAETVLDQPGRAGGALEPVPARPAQRQRRIAAPVEEEQRLLALLQRPPHLLQQHGGQEAAARRGGAAHVDRPEVGKRRLCEARGKHRAPVAPLHRVDPAFDGGRRRGQHHREAADAPAHHSHVAGVVEDAVLLLVGGVVLLVDDDQAEIVERQEQRRARPRHHLDAAFRHLPPHPLAHARRKIRMPFGRLGAETVLEALQEGMGQGDFRQKDQHLPALVQSGRHRLEIDLGLARACYAVEQGHAEAAVLDAGAQHVGRLALVARQFRQAIGRVGFGHRRARRYHHRLEHALRLQPVDHRGRHAGGVRQAGARPGKPPVGRLQHPLPGGGQAVGLAGSPLQPLQPRLGVEGFRRAQQHARHHAGRRQRVLRDPVDEAAHGPVDGRAVEDMVDRPQLPGVDRLHVGVPDDARHQPRPQRHAHDRARHDMHAFRNRIGVGAFRRHRHEHRRGRREGRILCHHA